MHPFYRLQTSSLLFLLLVFPVLSRAQTYLPGHTYFSPDGFIEYRCGSLPVIISAPHGGTILPAVIPDRTCNNPTLVTDINTAELAEAIDSAFLRQTGCRPHIIICHLSRKKMDANRDLADGACGNAAAIQAWTAFHDFLDSARRYVTDKSNKGFYIDLHGHGHAVQQLELGYLLTQSQLKYFNTTLDAGHFGDSSSIRSLSHNNLNGYTFSALMRGAYGLGTLLTARGFPSVPSQQKPYPPDTESYFDGGYNTAMYTSYSGGAIDGVQIETNYTGVRDGAASRRKFGDTLAAVLMTYMGKHLFGGTVFNCSTGIHTPAGGKGFTLFPNPNNGSFRIVLAPASVSGPVTVMIADAVGRQHLLKYPYEQTITVNEALSPGLYFIRVQCGGQWIGNVQLLVHE